MNNRAACIAIDKQADAFIDLAYKIWQNPETGWNEHKAVDWTAALLRENGFAVEVGAYGVPTAIRAVWGSGKPVIGFCAEYDALPGLSQKLSADPDPVEQGAPGHGCGHNLLGAGTVAAVVGLKAELEEKGLDGTVIFYGCPAEEVLLGKGYMAKGGAFAECDVTLAWHPDTGNDLTLGVFTSVESGIVRFKGRTAHAAGNPQDGRSALDAAQLFCLGTEFLREHVTDDVRMHYIYTDGGLAPNIVPDTAAVKFFVRAKTREAVMDAFARVVKCAEGASIMTETQYELERMGGVYPTLQNRVLAHHVHKVMCEMPRPEYTEEELAFCDAINRHSPYYQQGVTQPIVTGEPKIAHFDVGGSTDYGDVMHIVPSVMISEVCKATLSGGHSWMVTACSGHSVGMKGMLLGGKVMAVAAAKLCEDPSIVEAAKAEFAEVFKTRKAYECPITDEVKCPF